MKKRDVAKTNDTRDRRYSRVMHFEHTMRLLFGEAAYGIAGSEEIPSRRRQWLLKVVKKLRKESTQLDSTPRHREILLLHLKLLDAELRASLDASWEMIYELLSIVIRMFGYDYGEGEKLHTPIFVQDHYQHYKSSLTAGLKRKEYEEYSNNPIRIRRQLVRKFMDEGLDLFSISLILNSSEYEIKKLRSEKPDSRTGQIGFIDPAF